MGRKGRRGRSKKMQAPAASVAAVAVLDESPVTLPSAGAPIDAAVASKAEPNAPVEAAAPEATVEAAASGGPVDSATPADAPKGAPEVEAAEASVPPVGDLDAHFFAQSTSEVWLSHELELRDPQLLRKMTANVARRRARLARYVVGVVGVAVALCLAALIKSAVPVASDDSGSEPAAQMTTPAGEPPALAVPAPAPVEPAADGVDGGN
jgi:hypothetical protein